MAIASLRVPISALPSAAGSTAWLGELNTTVGGALDKAGQDKALARLADADATGQLAPNQGFLSRLFGGQQRSTSPVASAIPAPGAQSQLAVGLPAPVGSVDRGVAQGSTFEPFIDTVKTKVTNPYGLAAVAATGRAESGFDPENAARSWADPSQSGQPGTAGGVMSWRADRLQNLQRFARAKGEQGNGSPQTQAEFFLNEDPSLIEKLNNARSPQEAQSLMNNAWKFRGYDQPGGEAARRQALAQHYAGQFSKQGDVTGSVAPTQVASLDPGAGMSQIGDYTPYAPKTDEQRAAEQARLAPIMAQVGDNTPVGRVPQAPSVGVQPAPTGGPAFDPSTATPQQLVAALGNPNGVDPARFASGAVAQGRDGLAAALSAQGDGTAQPAQTAYVDPQVTTAARQAMPSAQGQAAAPTAAATPAIAPAASQVAQNTGARTLAAGITPVSRGSISPQLIQQMLRDPQLNQIGLQLWQQNATGKASEPWTFINLPDGTLARANQQSGEIEAIGQFNKPKASLQNVSKGSALYDESTGTWITPPEGAGGSNPDNYFGTVIKGYDADGNPLFIQPGKDGTSNKVPLPPGFKPENRFEKTDLGTSWLITDTTNGTTRQIPKDVQGEAFQKKVGTDTGEQAAGKVAASSSLGSTLSGLDRLADTVDSISSDPGLGKVTGWESKFPSFPGGEAAGVQARLNTLKSQVGFNVLQAMREASKTGGALGAVSDRENDLLQNNLAALDQAQSLDDFKKQLGKIKEYVAGAKQRLSGAYKQMYNEDFSAPVASAPAANAPDPLGIR